MKKKTRSRLSSNLSVTFCIAILICLLGAAGNFCGFYKSFNYSLSKLNETPIATITFKYKTAQRKLLERLVWDRLRQKSPLYNGDTVHTSDASEATVTFTDGNKIELFESTMIQIWKDEDSGKANAEIYDGSVYVESGDGETTDGVFLKSDGGSISVAMESGAAASVDLSRGGFVQVVSGNASISNAEGIVKNLSQGESLGVGQKDFQQPRFTMISPAPNKKILNHGKEDCNVDFEWKALDMPENTNLVLEVSSDKKFSKIANSEIINGIDHCTMAMGAGVWYWRIRNTTAENPLSAMVASRIQVIQSLPPDLLSPVQNYEINYRSRKPAIRFIWTETNRADNYRLVVADNEELKNPIIDQRGGSTSAVISTLKQGKYYWQVVPYFSTNREGFAAPSEVHSFSVVKSGTLNPPVPLVPAYNSIVNIEKDAKKTTFSWKSEPEAISYKLEFSREADFSKVEKNFDISINHVSLSGLNEFSAGRWFWRISQVDQEGNVSNTCEPVLFYAMEGKPEQHTVEPVDGYGIAENLMMDMNFTWKKNLPDFYKTSVQIASDQKFRNLVINVPVTGFSLSGIHLPRGTYWWRLYSKSSVDDFEMISSAKKLHVLSNLEASSIIAPVGKAVARDTVPYRFKWKEVEGADYYKIIIYRNTDNEIVYEDTVYDTTFDLDMFHPAEFRDRTDYKIEIQAKANAIPGVMSRRNGDLYETKFHLVKLRPIEIVIPKKNARFEGIDAALNKIKITWSSVDAVAEAQVVVSQRTKDGFIPVVKIPTDEEFAAGTKVAPATVLIANPDLRNGGDYEIVVHAKTNDGIDISNTDRKYIGEFSITPVEPLPKASGLSAVPAVLNGDYLRKKTNPRTITLNWSPVKNATDYHVEVKTGKGKTIFKEIISGKTSCEINWHELIQKRETEKLRKELYSGKFNWTVEAVRRVDADKDGKLDTELQPGIPASEMFVTDIPLLKKVNSKGAKNPYGK